MVKLSNLDINISDVIRQMRQLKHGYDSMELSYRKLSLKYEELGYSWRDSEYVRIKEYIDQAGIIIDRYKKDSDQYLDKVLINIQKLSEEYTENIPSDLKLDIELDDLIKIEELPKLI